MGRNRWVLGLAAASVAAVSGWQANQNPSPVDPVAKLQDDIATGAKKLRSDSKLGYLKSVLDHLQVPVESQIMVFSKTSLQTDYITRQTPRAFYFNDSVYVGYIPDAPLIEIMSVDPVRGARFYTIPNRPLAKVQFDPDDSDCNRCHLGGGNSAAMLLVRSVHTAPSGYARVLAPIELVLSGTPIEKRWGGWYVTGTHGQHRHMGNVESIGDDENYRLDTDKGANQTKLPAVVDRKRYLTDSSDIVALMVFERQMDVQNILSRGAQSISRSPAGMTSRIVKPMVDALVGVQDVRLRSPLAGTTKFAENYSRTGRADAHGRRLTELDLKSRLYRYAVHPLVDSPTVDAMPERARTELWRQLDDVLSGRNTAKEYAFLTESQRAESRELLMELRPDFRAVASASN